MVLYLLQEPYTGLETLIMNKNTIPSFLGELGTLQEFNMETNLEIDKMPDNSGDLKD
jgi:hypothetical protein